MKRQAVLGVQLACLWTAGCEAPMDDESRDSDDQNDEIVEVQSAFKNTFTFTNCGTEQDALIMNIRAFGSVLSNRIYENQGSTMRACLNDTFPSLANAGKWGGEIQSDYRRDTSTNITCSTNLSGVCGAGHDWWGCANVVSGEAVTLANEMILDSSLTNPQKAALLAHELAHNYGNIHPLAGNGEVEYGWTVPERVRSCVEQSGRCTTNAECISGFCASGTCSCSNNFQCESGNCVSGPSGGRCTYPAGQSRTNGMPAENELGYIGRFGGTPFELVGKNHQFVSGFTVRANATVNSLQVRHTDLFGNNFTSAVVGTQTGVLDSRLCNSNEVVVGISGRAGATINRLTVRCALRSNLSAQRDLTPSGDNNGIDYVSMCPAGKAVRHVRGRAGSTIDQIRLVCDDIGATFYTDNHAPHRVGSRAGSASGVLFSLRCSGNGALSSFEGSTSPNLRRLGGLCRATGSSSPLTPSSVTHPASNWLGGTGGTGFTNACNANELMVGLQVRNASGSSLTAIGPICADANGWDTNGGTPTRSPALSGASTGTVTSIQCPLFQFLVGLDAYGTSQVNGLHAVCADMR
jgi:hypothetical protein